MTYLLVFEATKDGKDTKGNIATVGTLPSLKDIREAENQLKESLNFDNVVITNMFEIADAEEEEK